jgi:hypothetical protein
MAQKNKKNYVSSHFEGILEDYANLFKYERPLVGEVFLSKETPFPTGPGLFGFRSGEEGFIRLRGCKVLSFEMPTYEALERLRKEGETVVLADGIGELGLLQLCLLLRIRRFERMEMGDGVYWFVVIDDKDKAMDQLLPQYLASREIKQDALEEALDDWQRTIFYGMIPAKKDEPEAIIQAPTDATQNVAEPLATESPVHDRKRPRDEDDDIKESESPSKCARVKE